MRHSLPVEGIYEWVPRPHPRDLWPATLAPVRQLLDEGLPLGPCTILVGENGAGKSTIVEAIAIAFGLASEGGSTGARHHTWASESTLHEHLSIRRGTASARWGYFLRAETMHGLFTYLAQNPSPHEPTQFHELSHGESFLAMLNSARFDGRGFFVLDEPEAGLSFQSQLALVGSLLNLQEARGSQLLIATHSPIIAALPGARLLQLSEEGIEETTWEDLATVHHHRSFLESPQRYLRHLAEPS